MTDIVRRAMLPVPDKENGDGNAFSLFGLEYGFVSLLSGDIGVPIDDGDAGHRTTVDERNNGA
ncbi:MAG: hypothetical protein ABSF80_11810 [Chitinispirillaceae bacterium]